MNDLQANTTIAIMIDSMNKELLVYNLEFSDY